MDSLDAFKNFLFMCVFKQFYNDVTGHRFLVWVNWASLICNFISLIQFERFVTIISSNFSFLSHSLSLLLWYSNYPHVKPFKIVPQFPKALWFSACLFHFARTVLAPRALVTNKTDLVSDIMEVHIQRDNKSKDNSVLRDLSKTLRFL